MMSDHAPLLFLDGAEITRDRTFRFEAFWLKMEGFQEVVLEAWEREEHSSDPVCRLHVKLERTTKALKHWHMTNFGDLKLQLAIAREVIQRLDLAQKERDLTMAERRLRINLRSKILGIMSINKVRMCQRARLNAIKLGDANTRLFQLRAS